MSTVPIKVRIVLPICCVRYLVPYFALISCDYRHWIIWQYHVTVSCDSILWWHHVTVSCDSIMCNIICQHHVTVIMYFLFYPGIRPYLCDYCGQSFTGISMLSKHKLMKHKPKHLSCPHCDYKTSLQVRLGTAGYSFQPSLLDIYQRGKALSHENPSCWKFLCRVVGHDSSVGEWMYLTVCPLHARVMIAQWENKCISLPVLPVALVMIAQ